MREDPFAYAKRRTRPLWRQAVRIAACILLLAGISLGGFLAVSPEARAWVTQRLSVIWGDKFAFFTAPEHQDRLPDLSQYRPAYIPEGFELVREWAPHEFFFTLTYRDGAGDYIDYNTASLSSSSTFEFIVDSEHSDSREIQINGLPATLLSSHTEGWPSHLLWEDAQAGIAYCITAMLDDETLIRVAESVTCVTG